MGQVTRVQLEAAWQRAAHARKRAGATAERIRRDRRRREQVRAERLGRVR